MGANSAGNAELSEPLKTERRLKMFAIGSLALLVLVLVGFVLKLATLSAPEPKKPSADSL